MKKLHFEYLMHVEYEKPVIEGYYKVKCIPVDNDRQKIDNVSISIHPSGDYSRGTDSFGNQTIYGSIYEEHSCFDIVVKGDSVTGILDSEPEIHEEQLYMYRHPGKLTSPGECIRAYYNKIKPEKECDSYQWAISVMHRIYADFVYEKNVTGINTTAEEALSLGKGVCQDYAHIMAALCRLNGLPARYVSGMLIGEGFSHAWVEVFCNGRWYGFDPTNDVLVTDSHIKIGVGRDAYDCQINRGIIKGGGSQTQTVEVKVNEIEEEEI